ncbi:ThiE Thiamine monophosphate synthase [Rhabdaerophilaceae bacterium]
MFARAFFFLYRHAMVPQFGLITPPIDDPAAFLPRFAALASSGALAVALLRVTAESDAAFKRKLDVLLPPLQEAGIACLIAPPDDPRLVARLGLDGVHARGSDDLEGLVEALKPNRIIGVGALRSRHEAMEAGERDIDYVMFGEPRADGSLPPLAQTIERAAWWAEIFTVPCIAYAPDLDAVAPLTETGADFIALGPWLFAADDPAELLAEARRIAKSSALAKAEALSAEQS